VLAALGRRPNIDDLGLQRVGAPLDEHGVPRFDPCTMRVGEYPIYIAGDADGYRPVLHEASDEGHIAGRNATDDEDTAYARREGLMIVFTDPNAAIVGPGWRLVRDRPHVVGSVDLARQSRLRMRGADRGLIRLYAGAEHGELLAAELCAPDGEHIAHLLALALQCRLTVFDLLRMPTYHPVVEEGLRKAVRDAARQVKDKAPGSDLALCETMPLDAVA
jgi:dihydrolipoamide dehydrogenase